MYSIASASITTTILNVNAQFYTPLLIDLDGLSLLISKSSLLLSSSWDHMS